ncbi:MAG: aminotransferase class I/II-fold pyridoxal phosphate-dependent enzyme [Phycisphaeraceae bacterium]|nr:aminotransferase class I/II-fold pyridoxal phosphate-dependent enzyme [Phycisphaeraceae bacterium]
MPITSLVSDRLRPFGSTIFAEMTALANKHGAVNLSQGFPDFDGPAAMLEAMGRAAAMGANQYAPMTGLPDLRRGVALWFARMGGFEVDPDAWVTVTCGCTEAIAATMLGLLNPGDGLVVFEPCYDSYQATASMAGARLLPVTLSPGEDGRWTYEPADLQAAFAASPKAILLNTPHNPTGKVFSHEELTEIARLCVEHNVIAITDEVYDHLVYRGEHRRLAGYPGMAERTITLGSIGKLFSATGWKVGWAVAPPTLTMCVRSAHQFLTFCANTPAQAAAAHALLEHMDSTEFLRENLRTNRDLLCDALERAGLEVYRPEAGYFVMCDHSAVSTGLGLDGDVTFSKHLVEAVGVAAIPPGSFYVDRSRGARFVRFAFCKKRGTIEAAIERLSILSRATHALRR